MEHSPLHRLGASAQLADALIKCKSDITVIQKMRWMGQAFEMLAFCSAMLISKISDADLSLIRGYDTLSLV